MTDYHFIESNLLFVLDELSTQSEVAVHFPSEMQSYDEQMEQVREYIVDAGEYGIAFEAIVSMLELFPFQLSGQASVKLLEVGLLMGFKTERMHDAKFDKRNKA